jgi:uncharacterized protein involved in outer membrane biogenesis
VLTPPLNRNVRVLPLLTGKVHITEIKVKGLSVLLVENEKGAVNWAFSPVTEPTPKAPSEPKPQAEKSDLKLAADSLVLADLILEDISVDYRSPGMKESVQFKIEECKGFMTPGKPFALTIKGMLPWPYRWLLRILKNLLMTGCK